MGQFWASFGRVLVETTVKHAFANHDDYLQYYLTKNSWWHRTLVLRPWIAPEAQQEITNLPVARLDLVYGAEGSSGKWEVWVSAGRWDPGETETHQSQHK